jgi:uncharacterized protein (TIGR02453 family)
MPDFPGFSPALFDFLTDLRFHNERPWFEANKGRYERDVREPALAYIAAMAPRLAAISPELVAEAKKVGGSLMRVHRDVRFAADKSPYKTNVGIQFRHAVGKDVHAPGLYVHLEPGGVFLAAGMWHPAADPLRQIRAAIQEQPAKWLAARDDDGFRGEWKLSGDSLKRAPRDVDPAHPLIDDLKRTDFIAVVELDESAALGPAFIERSAQAFGQTTPLMRFLCSAVGLAY